MKWTIPTLLLLALTMIARAQDAPPPTNPASQTNNGPRLELRPGEHYFRWEGRSTFLLGRNPAAMNPAAYEDHFRHAAAAGERFMRIHFTSIPPGEKAGEIDPGILQSWDAILDVAEQRGLAVLPVLGVWSDWNDGSNHETWHRWAQNPFNVERGGPAKRPGDLFDDTTCRALWLHRLGTMVRHWSHRRAIVAWEIFSELDLVTGATEDRVVPFAEAAAAVIRAADPWKRPVTASQSGIGEWPKLIASSALDFSEVHPYANGLFGGRLDDLILSSVRERLRKYGKPVLIGESGLDAGPPRGTLAVALRAEIGIRHAIWAAMVSGAMNGRALWWEDGYDQFEKADLCRQYQDAAAPAAAFVHGVDFSGFAPVPCLFADALKGAMIGNDHERLGWFRDAQCAPPEWPAQPLSGQFVTMNCPGSSWQVEFVDPAAGKIIGTVRVPVSEGRIRIPLPEFRGSIAARLKRVEP